MNGIKFFDFIKVIIYSLVFSILLLIFMFRMVIVNGSSMEETLQNGDRVIVTNYYQMWSKPQLGDIVAISPEVVEKVEEDGEHFDMPIIKRIIAKEGQTVGIDEATGDVYVDGTIIDEPYIKGTTSHGVEWDIPDKIPEGKVFVMGDNRAVSRDSRSSYIGLIDENQIIGKAEVVLFPFADFGYLY